MYEETLENKSLIQDYEKSYQFRIKQKQMKKELTDIRSEKPQNVGA